MTTPWFRLEGRSRSAAMTGGVEARIADPLWMLARQWQVGEFIGDDAGSPLAVTTRFETTSIDTTRLGGPGGRVPYDATTPLERTVEAAAPPRQGGARLARAARAAQSLTRLLRRSDAHQVVDKLIEAHPLANSDEITLGARGDALAAMLRRRTFDGLAVALLSEVQVRKLVDGVGPPSLGDDVAAWRRSVRAQFSMNDGAWRAERMEHDFAVTAPTTGEPLQLHADGYTGGRLDWYSFDVEEESESHLPLSEDVRSFTTIPTEVRYDGMPAARWWEFEDAGVQFGDLDAGPTDLSRMIVADFATVYGDDWFVVPLRLDHGTLCRIRAVEIVDSFGETTTATSIVANDERAKLGRSWAMFEMHGDTSVEKGVAPLLFLPPVLATSLHGPTTELVEFARDEGANLGWAIERTVEGPMGRSVDRRDAWLASTPPEPPPGPSDEPSRYEDQHWRYRLESPAPPFWVPLMPERIDPERSDIHFRRGQLQSWEHLTDTPVGAHGETLEPHRALTIREEEIPRGGITVERRWQYARWTDGSVHVWVQRRRRQGRGERSSGLSWDRLET